MMISVTLVSVFLTYILLMARIEYKSLEEVKQRNKEATHEELHESESFETQVLKYTKQGFFLNWPSLLIAALVYKWRHKGQGA